MKIKFFLLLAIVIMASIIVYRCQPNNSSNQLSKQEKEWLQNRRGSIIVGTEKNYPPFAFIDHQGFFRGISEDYLKEIEKYLGVTFVMAPPFHLARNLELIRDNEIDIVTSLSKTELRSEYMIFSDSYLSVPAVIIALDSVSESVQLSDLESYKIGVGHDYAVHEYLKVNFPDLKLMSYDDDLICLQKLLMGELDFVVSDISSASYLIRENSLLNLKVVGRTDFNYNLCIASRKDQPLLASSINKAIQSISKEKKELINKKWGALKIPLSKYQQIAYVFLPIGLLIILFLVIFIIRRKK